MKRKGLNFSQVTPGSGKSLLTLLFFAPIPATIFVFGVCYCVEQFFSSWASAGHVAVVFVCGSGGGAGRCHCLLWVEARDCAKHLLRSRSDQHYVAPSASSVKIRNCCFPACLFASSQVALLLMDLRHAPFTTAHVIRVNKM